MTPEEKAKRRARRRALAAAAATVLATAAVIVTMVRLATPTGEPANAWPAGVHKVWQVKWEDDVNPDPEAHRWLRVCTAPNIDDPVCERASYVTKLRNTETGKIWYTGVVRLGGLEDSPVVRALLEEEGYPDSFFSNEVTLNHGSMLIAPATPVPEPEFGSMFLVGVLGLGIMTWLRGGES